MSPGRHRHHFLPEHTGDKLEFVSNAALTLMMRQMADLVRQAEDIFSSLEGECRSVNSRASTVLARMNKLQETVLHQDSLTEIVGNLRPLANNISLMFPIIEDLDSCRKVAKHASSTSEEETDLFLPATRARCVRSLYAAAKSPERDSKAREEPEPSYLCIPIQTEVNYKYFNVETETKRVSKVSSRSELKLKVNFVIRFCLSTTWRCEAAQRGGT